MGIINANSCNWRINAKILRYLIVLTNKRYELICAADGSNWKTNCCMIGGGRNSSFDGVWLVECFVASST